MLYLIFTHTVADMLRPLALNLITAVPVLSFTLMANTACQLASVSWLPGETAISRLPFLLIVDVTVTPSTRQLSSPFTVTVTLPFPFFLSVNLLGSAVIDVALHRLVESLT